MWCEQLYERRQRRELTITEPEEILGMTERTFRRGGTLRSRWQSRQDPADAGAPYFIAIGHHVHFGVFAGSAGRSERVFRTLQDRLPGSRRWRRPPVST